MKLKSLGLALGLVLALPLPNASCLPSLSEDGESPAPAALKITAPLTQEVNLYRYLRPLTVTDPLFAKLSSSSLPAVRDLFATDLRRYVAQGDTRVAYYHLVIENHGSTPLEISLYNNFPTLSAWVLDLSDLANIQSHHKDEFAAKKRVLPRYARFAIRPQPGHNEYVLIEVSTPFHQSNTWFVWPDKDLRKFVQLKDTVQNSVFSTAMLMLILTLAIGMFQDFKSFFLTTSSFSFLVILLSLEIGSFSILPLDWIVGAPWLVHILMTLSITIFSMSHFTLFEITPKNHPWLWRILVANCVSQALSLTLALVYNDPMLPICLVAWIFGFLVILLDISWLALRHGDRDALLLCSFSSPAIISGAVRIAGFIRVLEPHRWGVETTIILVAFIQVGFTLIISNKMYRKKIEASRIKSSILMARSIQDLLLPSKLHDEQDGTSYDFLYYPYDGLISGDWLNRWTSPDGSKHFLIGDVTGKGPQAALAVASIAMSIHKNKVRNGDLESCLKIINADLYRNFRGLGTTTVTALTLCPDSSVLLYNAGGLGWHLYRDHKTIRLLSRHGLLGLGDTIEIEPIRERLAAGEALLSFTDGLAPTSTMQQKVVKRFFAKWSDGTKISALVDTARLVMENKQVGSDDDTAAVLIRKKAA